MSDFEIDWRLINVYYKLVLIIESLGKKMIWSKSNACRMPFECLIFYFTKEILSLYIIILATDLNHDS